MGPSSVWLGGWQRACPQVEAGETGAAEAGQAKTGPTDQATSKHARMASRSTHAGEWWEKASTHIRLVTEADRGEHDVNLSHQSHEGSSYLTRCKQQPGRGLGRELCALDESRLYISAPRLTLHERHLTDKAPPSNKTNAQPQYCAQQEFLQHLARLVGVNAVTVWAVGKYLAAK